MTLTDLEADYLNPYETASRINGVVIPEFLLHGTFCVLFLLAGNWIFFLITLLPAYLNARRYLERQHLIDVTEIFRKVNDEKKLRTIKMGFHLILFVFILIRLIFSFINAVADEDEQLHFYGLF
ncbi:OLC1v1037022C1 [Oldenlandia corymbosa var. corymbosa]|nr:OLC1v1037022C1 [Oldenlandia corymbosa var. corymbosa]